MLTFLHSLNIAVVDDLWNGLFDVGSVLQLSSLQAYLTMGFIMGLMEASADIYQLDRMLA